MSGLTKARTSSEIQHEVCARVVVWNCLPGTREPSNQIEHMHTHGTSTFAIHPDPRRIPRSTYPTAPQTTPPSPQNVRQRDLTNRKATALSQRTCRESWALREVWGFEQNRLHRTIPTSFDVYYQGGTIEISRKTHPTSQSSTISLASLDIQYLYPMNTGAGFLLA